MAYHQTARSILIFLVQNHGSIKQEWKNLSAVCFNKDQLMEVAHALRKFQSSINQE